MRRHFSIASLAILISAATMAPAADPPKGAKQIFNGKDMSGWEHVGPGSFSVENGMLKTQGGMGLLWYTGEKIGNATLRLVYKVNRLDANSGVFIRVKDKPKDEWFAVHNGYEVQIMDKGPDEWHSTGAIYSLSKAEAQPAKPVAEWNVLEIRLDGPLTIVHLNGVKVNEYKEGQPVPERKHDYEPIRGPRPNMGYIGLQNHDEKSTVLFKEVSVQPLKLERGRSSR